MKWVCPYCLREMEIGSLEELPHMPFCSERCKMADLNSWLSGHYIISRPVEEGDIGETTAADLSPPPGARPHGAPGLGDPRTN